MKTLFFIIALALSTSMFAQNSKESEKLDLSNLKVAMTVENLKELEDFNPEDLREVFLEMNENEEIEFSLKFIYPEQVKDPNIKKSFSYKLSGNSNEIEDLLNSITYIQKIAVKVASK